MSRNLFLDTCALVKIYVQEDHSDEVRGWVLDANLYCSQLVHTELRAALWAKVRRGFLSPESCALCLTRVAADSSAFTMVHTSEAILMDAGNLTAAYELRSLDAIHLSSVITVRSRVPDVEMVTFDNRLRVAAADVGFKMLPRVWPPAAKT